jgi:hypothetical protein
MTRGAMGTPRGSREERVLLLPAGYEADRLSATGLSEPGGEAWGSDQTRLRIRSWT